MNPYLGTLHCRINEGTIDTGNNRGSISKHGKQKQAAHKTQLATMRCYLDQIPEQVK